MLHLRDQVELQALKVAPGVAVADERNLGLLRLEARVAQRRPLIRRGQEARAEVVGPPLRQVLADRDVSGEVLVLAPEPVRDPRTHARPDERVGPRVPFQHGTAVARVRAVHRVNDAEVVGAGRQFREKASSPRHRSRRTVGTQTASRRDSPSGLETKGRGDGFRERAACRCRARAAVWGRRYRGARARQT